MRERVVARWVEHVFAVVKRLWGFTKVRYRGLAKNATRSFVALSWPTSTWLEGAWRECVRSERRARRSTRHATCPEPSLADQGFQTPCRACTQHQVAEIGGLFSVALSKTQMPIEIASDQMARRSQIA
jgi:hypothetical protein